jgi:hypothetical protein
MNEFGLIVLVAVLAFYAMTWGQGGTDCNP